jgi:hypothetical protein
MTRACCVPEVGKNAYTLKCSFPGAALATSVISSRTIVGGKIRSIERIR